MSHFVSPLRYPGGKRKLTPYIVDTMIKNNLIGGTYVEPFAGGASIAWYLLLNNLVSKVHINDLNDAVYCFWYSVLNHTDLLCEKISNSEVSIQEWRRQKNILCDLSSSTLEKGFATFFLNRTNRSGIINAGVIGGLAQEGNFKIDCRFNKEDLINRILAISSRKQDIKLFNLDAVDYIKEVIPGLEAKSLINIDPPYYHKGKGLYQNFFEHSDHVRLFEYVRNIDKPWIVTYDDTPEIMDIYHEFSPLVFGINYSAQNKRRGSEVLICEPSILRSELKPDAAFREMPRI